jgi:hypothetical protein
MSRGANLKAVELVSFAGDNEEVRVTEQNWIQDLLEHGDLLNQENYQNLPKLIN